MPSAETTPSSAMDSEAPFLDVITPRSSPEPHRPTTPPTAIPTHMLEMLSPNPPPETSFAVSTPSAGHSDAPSSSQIPSSQSHTSATQPPAHDSRTPFPPPELSSKSLVFETPLTATSFAVPTNSATLDSSYRIVEILPYLYISNRPPTYQAIPNDITHVLNMSSEYLIIKAPRRKLHLPLDYRMPITSYIRVVSNFITWARSCRFGERTFCSQPYECEMSSDDPIIPTFVRIKPYFGGLEPKVLICCEDGVNRSAAAFLAYMGYMHEWSMERAMRLL